MNVIDMAQVDASMVGLVGGKAAGLGELIAAGERVPGGFCVTTEVYDAAGRAGGDLSPQARAEIIDAYERLGAGAVAVRSSATVEDLPDVSSAGQQETFLDVRGAAEVIDAVRYCWDSLWSERAVAYREASGLSHQPVQMAVVVQRMVRPHVAGVLFTADPVTGSRSRMTVDAAPGPGTAVVGGTVVPDHYVLDGRPPGEPGGCLDAAHLAELHAAGLRIQRHFGSPQDIEWAIDSDGVLWVLQSRPVTGLFPLPPDTGRPKPRVYLNFSPAQGMHRPFTPMGMSVLRTVMARWWRVFGLKAGVDPTGGPEGIVDVGGRVFGDVTRPVRNRTARRYLATMMRIESPQVAAALGLLMQDPRFRPHTGLPFRPRTAAVLMTRLLPSLAVETTRTLARPDAVRARAFEAAERIRRSVRPPAASATAAERLRFVTQAHGVFLNRTTLRELVWPVYAGLLAAELPVLLLRGVASAGEVRTVLHGMPHNVTTEMDLELWRLATAAREHRDLLLNTPPSELAAEYRQGGLPDIGLADFLARHGRRAAAEIDVGRPRWSEDPEPVFTAIANYLRVTDPDQAPDRRFAASARQAEATLEALVRRARRRRPVRARLAGFLLRRARAVGGLRELPKSAWTHLLQEVRHQLLLVGADLADRGLLDRADDIMFVTLPEAEAAVAGAGTHEMKETVAGRRAAYRRETRRRRVPDVLLSDGTDVGTLVPAAPSREGTLVGMPGSAGTVTGPARVVSDPAGARLEPGEILVAPSTDPGWTPLFMTAGGLVTEAGGPNAHGPTVAREYGIPAVIGVPHATRRIRTGRQVTLDGATGTVQIH